MIIGLMRHFPVNFSFSKWSNPETFNRDMNTYNNSPVRPMKPGYEDREWDRCFTSTMKRAVETARVVFPGNSVQSDLLREVPLVAGFRTPLKIPVFLWAVIGRFQWLLNSGRQPEKRIQSYRRARAFISENCMNATKEHKILIITHGFFMLSLRRELLRLGLRGPKLIHVKNGKLYRFEKKQPDQKLPAMDGD